MDNPTRWNITNSAQNIVSALVDPSKQFDHVFRREWTKTFSGFTRHGPSLRGRQDAELKAKLSHYLHKLEDRKHIKIFEADSEAKKREQQDLSNDDKPLVPEVFLMEKFELSDLETFSRVISASSSNNNNNDDEKRENNNDSRSDAMQPVKQKRPDRLLTKTQLKELQQDLTDYLDIIEEKLASQISSRSGDFFQVMSSVDSVMDQLSLAIKSVTCLRRKCSTLNDTLILPHMQNIYLRRRRDNAQIVLDKMKEIHDLYKVQPMIQLLLTTSDFDGALDLIAKSRFMLNTELARVDCLKHLEAQLVETERVIGAMMQQEFISLIAFHDERRKRIESMLDIEQWKIVEDIPPEFQRLITMIVDENISIIETFSSDQMNQFNPNQSNSYKQHSRASSDVANLALEDADSSSKNLPEQANGYSKQLSSRSIASNLSNLEHLSDRKQQHKTRERMSYVRAGGSTYVIVNSVINLTRSIIDYCKYAHEIRSLSAEILERLFNILQLYNSKTYQLVYSAGAIQVAGLKTITTRSLVVSQRSLKLITLLIPALKRHFSQLLPDYNRLRRLDEIKLSYEDHAAKISERVNSIVRDVINLQLQEWEAKPPVPSPQFTAVAQHLTRLHNNIQDALPPDELKLLFEKISQTFKDVLIMHLRRLNITNDAGPQQWLVTQELTFYKISSAKLSVFKGLELNFDDLWTRLNSESAPKQTAISSVSSTADLRAGESSEEAQANEEM